MASEDTIVKKLIINNITEEEFEAKKAAGELDPNEIYLTPDKTDEKLAGKVSIAQGEENAGKVLVISENGEVVPGEVAPTEPQAGASMPILTHIFADHELNDMSWLNADTFSWQSGDVYVAAYEHLASEVAIETETKKYIRCKTVTVSGDYRDDDNVYYREPSYDLSDDIVYDEGYAFAWVAVSSDIMVVTNTETPAESDVIYYRSKIYPEDPPPYSGRVVEAGEETLYSNAETETIDGITITFYRAEDGHKICPADQETNVQALYEATGIAWYYILDTENQQFKLPRTKFGFTGLRDNVGNYVEAGLPDIAGRAEVVGYTTTAGGAWSTGGSLSGSIWTRKTSGAVSESGYWFDGQLRFTASRSNSIYGNSNTVQPPATQMYLYFYVGNFEREAIEQTAGITSEQLNNKADKSTVEGQLSNKADTTYVNEQLAIKANADLSNIPSAYDYVVAKQKPNASNNYTWYKKYKSGWVEQGGRYVNQSSTGRQITLTATLPIPVTGSTVIASPEYVSGDSIVVVTSWSTGTVVNTIVEKNTISATSSTTSSARWVVFGNAQ